MIKVDVERDERVAQLLEEALAEFLSRGVVDADAWRRGHPEEADEVLRLLNTVQALEGPSPTAEGAATRPLTPWS